MKKKEMLKRLSAAIFAGTMMLAAGTNVLAAETNVATPGVAESPTSITLTKKVTAGENVKAPNTTFKFQIATGDEEIEDGVTKSYAGVSGGLFFAEGENEISFTPGGEFENTTQISLDVTKFTIPGIYHYIVTETEGEYDGMTYDETAYDVYAYVVNGENGLKISAVESKNDGTKSDLSFDNTYDTHKLTLTKLIKGNQANKNKEFEFTLTINGAEGEQYTAVNGTNIATLTSGTPVTYELGNEETVVIYGLSENDTYSIVEEDCSNDGYITTITGSEDTDGLTASGTEGTTDQTVTYTNTKEVSTPTGIVTNVLPYVLMVAFAGGIAVVFLRKREYEG